MLGTQCYLERDLCRMVGVKALSGREEMRALAKRAKGDIAHQFSWCGGRLCLLSVATWYANASCRIWMILKPVLSCQQEIQEMFSTFGVMQLGQTYLHLSTYIWKDLNEQATILRGISWRMPARGSQSWRFRRQRSGQDATSLGSTVVGLGCYHMTCTRSFKIYDIQLLQLKAVSATIYDCVMQIQCINTWESWPYVVLRLPSRQQFPNIPNSGGAARVLKF